MIKRTLLAFALCAGAAHAQSASRAGEFERGFGGGAGAYEQPIEVGTRDVNGNRLIVNGRIMLGQSTLSGGLLDNEAGVGAASAIGNQLNVITQGNWNTVIVESTQTNTGDVTADVNGGR